MVVRYLGMLGCPHESMDPGSWRSSADKAEAIQLVPSYTNPEEIRFKL